MEDPIYREYLKLMKSHRREMKQQTTNLDYYYMRKNDFKFCECCNKNIYYFYFSQFYQ